MEPMITEDHVEDWTCACGCAMVAVGRMQGEKDGASGIDTWCVPCRKPHFFVAPLGGVLSEDFRPFPADVWAALVAQGELPPDLSDLAVVQMDRHASRCGSLYGAGRGALHDEADRRRKLRKSLSVEAIRNIMQFRVPLEP